MRSFKTLAAACLAALAPFLAAGCANTYQQNHMAQARSEQGKMLIAVMPFQGVSESPGSGLIVADVMANELYGLGGYTVVTPEVAAARAAAREGETLSPAETGKLIGAPLILTGRVTEYTYKSGVGEQPAVGITARLIETETGRVVWSATRARTGSAAWFQEDSLGLLTSRICRSLANSMDGKAKSYHWSGSDDEYSVQAYPLPKPEPKPGAKPDAEAKVAPASLTLPGGWELAPMPDAPAAEPLAFAGQ